MDQIKLRDDIRKVLWNLVEAIRNENEFPISKIDYIIENGANEINSSYKREINIISDKNRKELDSLRKAVNGIDKILKRVK